MFYVNTYTDVILTLILPPVFNPQLPFRAVRTSQISLTHFNKINSFLLSQVEDKQHLFKSCNVHMLAREHVVWKVISKLTWTPLISQVKVPAEGGPPCIMSPSKSGWHKNVREPQLNFFFFVFASSAHFSMQTQKCKQNCDVWLHLPGSDWM